ncbi:MAG: hypothetical protein ABWY82_21775, partial [Tardiphaga sp.]
MRLALSIVTDAVAYGMALFIISIGLSIMMGLMRVVNLAHGAFAMIGGYLASYAIRDLGVHYSVAILLAVVGTILVSIPFELLLYRRIYRKSDPLIQVLMTIGITFLIIGVMNFIFGPSLKSIPLPPLLNGPLDIGFRSIPTHRLFVISIGLSVTMGLMKVVNLAHGAFAMIGGYVASYAARDLG